MRNSSYIALSTPYYSFDPRAKIIFTLLMCVLPFLPLTWMAQSLLTLLVVVLSCTQIGVKNTLKNIKVILPILILMTLLMPLQGRGGEPLLTVKNVLIVSENSLYSWQKILNRFLLLSLMCSLLMETTKSSSILLSLRSFHMPYSVALVLSLSLRLIPTISDTFMEIRDSQRLRLPNPGEEEAKKKAMPILEQWRGQEPLHMKTTWLFNMVNTSIVLGLAPAEENSWHRLDEMYTALESVVPLGYALTPHITMAYFKPGTYTQYDLNCLRPALHPVELEVTLSPEDLSYQEFRDMNHYQTKAF